MSKSILKAALQSKCIITVILLWKLLELFLSSCITKVIDTVPMDVTGFVFVFFSLHWLPNIPCAIELFRVRASLSRSRGSCV